MDGLSEIERRIAWARETISERELMYNSVMSFIAAVVIDGVVCDLSELEQSAPPVFARAVPHLGPYKEGPGDLRGPVSICGLVVECGDLVICDEDGVAVIPLAQAESGLEIN